MGSSNRRPWALLSARRSVASVLWIGAFTALLSGCGDPSDIDAIECTPGTLGCLCDADTCGMHDDAAMRCVANRCVVPDCVPGTLDCGCRAGDTCSAWSAAGALRCVDDLCALDGCPTGTDGCACTPAGACGAGLRCDADTRICAPHAACPAGRQGCPCHADGGCDAAEGDAPALRCDAGYCMPDECERGTRDCGCLPGGQCVDGSVCEGLFCVEDTGQTLVPPADPKCYTPCRADMVAADGRIIRRCDDEGVMAGCIGATLCIDGSCVADGARAKSDGGCFDSSECPAIQTCIKPAGQALGRCYSDCVDSADCNGSRTCVARVCRLPCSSADAAVCGDQGWCKLGDDGVNGHCFALAMAPADSAPMTAGVGTSALTYDVWRSDLDGPVEANAAPPALGLTQGEPCRGVRVRNTSNTTLELRLRRVSHTLTTSTGEQQVSEPTAHVLPWLGISTARCPIAANRAEEDPELTLEAGETGRIFFAMQPGPDVRTVAGTLAMEAKRAGEGAVESRLFDVTFARGPLGRWAGDLWVFADFDTTDLAAWAVDRPDLPSADANAPRVRNALVLRWLALREGRLPLSEFLSAVRALRDGTWALPAVRAICPEGAVCYLADTPEGYGVFSDDADDIRLPSAPSRIPFTLDLASEAGETIAGRILSAETLQYPGDPRITARFGELDDAGAMRPIDSLTARVVVGGRLAHKGEGACPAGLISDTEPWLVPGFIDETDPSERAGERARTRCLERDTPFAGDEALNRSLARANPLPDGQGMERTLEVIDAALIADQLIFALVKETITTPLAMTGGEPLTAYGYLLLERETAVDALAASPQPQAPAGAPAAAGVTCDPALITEFLGAVGDGALSNAAANRLAVAVVDGAVPVDLGTLTPIDGEIEVGHALCVATDTLDGGPEQTACPADSGVVFFTLPPRAPGAPSIAAHACHAAAACQAPDACPGCVASDACEAECEGDDACLKPSCGAVVRGWVDDPAVEIRIHPYTRFEGGDAAEGRCAARDGDLAACHVFYAERGPAPIVEAFDGERIGYICHATGFAIDPTAPGNAREPCPQGSAVTFFAWTPSEDLPSLGSLACQGEAGVCRDGEPCSRFVCSGQDCDRACPPNEPCESKGACVEALERGDPALTAAVDTDIAWRCADRLRGTCSDDRDDLTADKVFFRPADGAETRRRAAPLDDAVEAAFRYETRFRNRNGTSLGFTPTICDAASTPQSYCYDPDEIGAIARRVDCAVSLFTTRADDLTDSVRDQLQAVLVRTFSMREERRAGLAYPITHDGFERARAKLLVMLGDEAMTQALSSRFDQAGIRQATFRGQDFEAGGIELQGVAGFEMYSLHLAVQYYDLALSRFFDLGAAINDSIEAEAEDRGFITQGTAVAWFERLLRASTRKAAAQAEIAERYRIMAAPAVGRRVVERASAATHLESVLFSRVIQDLIDVSEAAAAPQIRRALQDAQTRWGAAMRQLAATYALLDDTPRFLGIPQGFVPFPPLDSDTLDVNAFEKLLTSARRKVAIAADKEVQAIEDSRAFDTSAAEFRRTLAALRTDYEAQIGEICGTFVGDDGAVYAAIARNAHRDPRARALGDPCGRMGTGAIVSKLAESEGFRLKLEEARTQQLNLYGTMDGLNETLELHCERIGRLQDFTWQTRTDTISLRQTIAALDVAIDTADRTLSILDGAADGAKCIPPTIGFSNSPGNCVQISSATILTTSAQVKTLIAVTLAKTTQIGLEVAADRIEQELERYEILDECRALQIDTYSDITGLFAEIPILANRVEQQMVAVERVVGEIESLYNRAQALQAAYVEAETLAIDVEAARNDPNVRIYRSDAVLAADRTFSAALEEVYEATLVFEYYTGQSYAERDRLRFMRLAQYGEDNLERYLAELADAFDDFEQTFGNPDLRVTIVSLRDVLAPGVLAGSGAPRTVAERTVAFRDALRETSVTDPLGRYTVDFRLAFARVSPLTFGHKVRSVEAELVGQGLGDALARVYLTPAGTATVRGVEEDQQLRLSPRTAVLDAFFNGDRDARLDPAIYRSERLRDQPLINTRWQVVFDPVAEQVNRDVPIDALEDIRFYIYYTDFTEAQ